MRGICGVLIFATAWLWAEEQLPDAECILIQGALERMNAAKSVRLEWRIESVTDLEGTVVRFEKSVSVVSLRGAEDVDRQTRFEVNVAGGATKEHWIQLPGMKYRSDSNGKRLDCYLNRSCNDHFTQALLFRQIPWALLVHMGPPFFEKNKRPLPEKVLEGVACVGFASETEACTYTVYYGKDDRLPRLMEIRIGESFDIIRLTRVEFDSPIDPAAFTLQPPPDTEIYKQVRLMPKPKPKTNQRQIGEEIKMERVVSVDSPFPEEKAPVPERVIRGEDF